MPAVLVHIANEDPVLGEVENLPGPADTNILVKNPRKRDGKDLHYLLANVTQMILPINRLTFIEIMPGEEDEDLIGFVRE